MALEEARKRKLLTVALLGYDGGEIQRRGLADFPVVVKCDYIPRIQEVQASIYHVIRELLEVLDRGQGLNSMAPPGVRYTQEMREWLEWQRHDFVEYDVESDPAARQRLHELASGVVSIPVLIQDRRVVEVGWQGRTCMISVGAAGCPGGDSPFRPESQTRRR